MNYLILTILGLLHVSLAQTNNTKVACEGETINLECTNGQVIEILSANYGRTDGVTCPNNSMSNQNCVSSSAFKIISTKCNDKSTCSVYGSVTVFGDPCPYTDKYTTIQYRCISSNTKVACEGETIHLECTNDEVIEIINANYGRTDGVTCPNNSMSNQNCVSDSAFEIISNKCNDKSTCSVYGSVTVFGDPCPYTDKYTTIQYRCVPTNTKVACEGETINLECAKGEVIQITNASYGRTDGVTCRNNSISNQNCVSDSAPYLISTECNDKRTCSVYASYEVFGDPCSGTDKYTTIQYKCINSSIQTAISCYPQSITLSCPTGKVLDIVKANYGRTDGVTCPNTTMSNKNCYAVGTSERVGKICNNVNSCTVSPSIFGDPCFGTYKYLDIQYNCVAANQCNGSVFSCSDMDCVNQYCKSYVCDYGSGPLCTNVQ